jgi:hypothetical protein
MLLLSFFLNYNYNLVPIKHEQLLNSDGVCAYEEVFSRFNRSRKFGSMSPAIGKKIGQHYAYVV